MKLVRIDHLRCGEVAASTYLWAPDDTTPEQFTADVAAAAAAYTADAAAAAAFAGPRPARTYPPFSRSLELAREDPDELTVGEIRARAAREQASWQAWEERRRAASRPFGAYLISHGYLAFPDHEPALTGEISWGHAHGVSIDYAVTDPSRRDLPGALRRRPTHRRGKPVTVVGYEEYLAADPTDPLTPSADPDQD